MPIAPRLSILLAAVPRPAGQDGTHTARIRSLYAALRASDVRAALAHLAPGVDWEEDRGEPGLPLRRRHTGHAQVARVLAAPQGPLRALELVHLVESGPEVAVLAAEGPAPQGEGVAPLRLEAHLWTLDDAGLVTRFRQVAAPPRAPRLH